MITIVPAFEHVAAICGKQNMGPGRYRLSHHCLQVSCEDGELLYQNMTGEMLLLQRTETIENVHDDLVRKWFLVPEEFDEEKLARQLRQVIKLMIPRKEGIHSFLVFTTTDCNARCAYCYELGRSRLHMSEQVAHDAATYIEAQNYGQIIQIRWFGGEPLFNRRAIEIITGDLRKHGVLYRSHMTTNGFLFDATTVETAVKDWKLDSVQISLDGTEKVYNKKKAYIYQDGSAYRRVLENISLLGAAGVNVNIRLNMDRGNFDNLMLLAEELAARFGKEEAVKVYIALLKDFGNPIQGFDSMGEQIHRYEQLREKLHILGIEKTRYLERKVSITRCMADSDHSITILPDGRLGKCEHESEEKLVGSIYGDKLDQNVINTWKETIYIPECRTCVQYPSCVKLRECAWTDNQCTEADRNLMRTILTDKIRSTYLREKEEKGL